MMMTLEAALDAATSMTINTKNRHRMSASRGTL
jgi:hypothetical protein